MKSERPTSRRFRSTQRQALEAVCGARAETFLRCGEIVSCELLTSGSNYTFLSTLRYGGASGLAIYKPRRGEMPLWDFPTGTLYRREYAAYLLSEELGWHLIPPTIVRDGPHGVGSLQLYVDADPRANYFTFARGQVAALKRISLFDCVANNADRKAGHCLLGKDGHVWAIDHGLTFNVVSKVRTVIWDFAGSPIPEQLLADLAVLMPALEPAGGLSTRLRELLSGAEVAALGQRVAELLALRRFPQAGAGRNIPWPPV